MQQIIIRFIFVLLIGMQVVYANRDCERACIRAGENKDLARRECKMMDTGRPDWGLCVAYSVSVAERPSIARKECAQFINVPNGWLGCAIHSSRAGERIGIARVECARFKVVPPYWDLCVQGSILTGEHPSEARSYCASFAGEKTPSDFGACVLDVSREGMRGPAARNWCSQE